MEEKLHNLIWIGQVNRLNMYLGTYLLKVGSHSDSVSIQKIDCRSSASLNSE